MKARIGSYSKANSLSWQGGHGRVRSNFKVPSYAFITLDTYAMVMDWLALGIDHPGPRLPPRYTPQLALFGDAS